MAKPLFNMSRTLSIGNEGPRALEFALGPVYLGWNPRWTAHVWFDAVRQFNIRPSRMKCRCISLLRLAPPCRCLSFGVRGGFAAAPKNPRMGPTLVELGGSGKDQAMSAARPLCPSAMRPTAQHASSPAIATLATLDCLPEASIARCLSTSRRTPALAWRRASGGTDWPLAGLFGARDALL